MFTRNPEELARLTFVKDAIEKADKSGTQWWEDRCDVPGWQTRVGVFHVPAGWALADDRSATGVVRTVIFSTRAEAVAACRVIVQHAREHISDTEDMNRSGPS